MRTKFVSEVGWVRRLFVLFLVLVLSIAVLVLVLGHSLRYCLGTLDQSSQHGHNPFQIGLANPIEFRIDRRKRNEDIMNRGTFQSRAARDLEESILVLEALLPIALLNIQRNGPGGSKPLVAHVSFRAIERFRDRIR